jgi:hypothetical protein
MSWINFFYGFNLNFKMHSLSLTTLFPLRRIFFEKLQIFILQIWLSTKNVNYFCDVAKLAIIHKKIYTFGYRQVMELETC